MLLPLLLLLLLSNPVDLGLLECFYLLLNLTKQTFELIIIMHVCLRVCVGAWVLFGFCDCFVFLLMFFFSLLQFVYVLYRLKMHAYHITGVT